MTAEKGFFSGACALEALKLTSRTPKVRKSVCRTGMAILLSLSSSAAIAQNGDANALSSQPANSSEPSEVISSKGRNNTAAQPTAASKSWIVRDPTTGRVFQQQLVPVSVPVTRWEPRTIEQTVYEPRVATQVQQVPQTTYIPNTQYVMQPKVTGWWNPFKQPVQAYQYVPVTNWLPQTQQVPNPITTQQWVPRQQKIVVYQPVQSTEIRQQLVQTELPQPPTASTAIASVPAPRQPLFRLPILAQQRVLPWAAPAAPATGYGNTVAATAPTTPLASPNPAPQYSTAQTSWQPVGQQSSQPALANAKSYLPPAYSPTIIPPQYATNGLRPVTSLRSPLVLPPLSLPRFAASPYSAPLQATSSIGSTASRDTLQSGMQPTVLR